ncbi:MAG: DMT family transporter, partial [Pseudomonadota bacterium]
IMVRFVAFAIFAAVFVAVRSDLLQAARASRPGLQILRSLLLVSEILIFAAALRSLSLPLTHALFLTFPLMITALSVPVLGEPVGWRRWLAVVVGFIGMLVILRPGIGEFEPASLLILGCALIFALYNLLTRMASRHDSFETSILYVALIGAIVASLAGLASWKAPTSHQWMLLTMLSIAGISGHMLLIKALEWAPAATLQPLNYSMIVWGTLLSIIFFKTWPDGPTIIGAMIVIGSGLFITWREQRRSRQRPVRTATS